MDKLTMKAMLIPVGLNELLDFVRLCHSSFPSLPHRLYHPTYPPPSGDSSDHTIKAQFTHVALTTQAALTSEPVSRHIPHSHRRKALHLTKALMLNGWARLRAFKVEQQTRETLMLRTCEGSHVLLTSIIQQESNARINPRRA
jgi:hypothetical protein